MSAQIIRLNPPTLPDSGAIGYSQISIAAPGRMAYISGQVALPPGGGPVPVDLAGQMKVVGHNLRVALEALKAGPEHIVIARCYVVDLTPERLAALMPPLIEAFDGAKPSLTGIGVAALAGPEFQVEVELTVRLPE